MGPDPVRIEIELAPDQRAPRLARAALDRLTAGVAGDVGFRARLLVSELVTNSVLHRVAEEAAPIRLTVLRTREAIRVEIRDHGRPFDGQARVVSERATSGRGLRLVQALVDRWGVEQQDGNLVWFEIDQPAGSNPSGRKPPSDALAAAPRPRQ